MNSSRRVVVASVSRSTELLVERATRNAGFTLHSVAPMPEAIRGCLDDGGGSAVVLDALQQSVSAVDCVRSVMSSHPDARIIVLGDRPDLGVVARFVRAGAWNYLLPYVGAPEFLEAVDGAASGRAAAADTLFGRVRACLPIRKVADGSVLMSDGSRLGLADVVKRCVSIGLSQEEIAACVGLSVADVVSSKVSDQARRRASGSGATNWLSEFVRGMAARDGAATGSGRKAASEDGGLLRPELKILGLFVLAVFGVFITPWLWTTRGPAVYGTQGTVSYQGQSIGVGEIVFEPQSESGQRRTATIKDGRFELPKKEGFPLWQSYLVRVYGYRETAEKYKNADMSQSAVIQEQFLPAQYNQETQLKFETTPDALRAGLPLELQ